MLKATLLKAAGSPTLQKQVTSNPVARRVAARFIAGNNLDDADRVIRELNARGVSVALDYLGENTESEKQARESTAAYLAALDRIQDHQLDANISVKLTALGLDISHELALEEASKVAARGKEIGAMVGVDMEAYQYVEDTIETIGRLRQSYDNVGVCVQSYLYRTPGDVDRLNAWGVPVRLVKGAYRESQEVAYAEKAKVDSAFADLLEEVIAHNRYPMVATHDPAFVRLTKRLVAKHQRDRGTFEFQMLYGIRRDLQQQVVAEGYRLRVYVPYGTQWYPYFMRRLAERPANLYFFLSNLVKR